MNAIIVRHQAAKQPPTVWNQSQAPSAGMSRLLVAVDQQIHNELMLNKTILRFASRHRVFTVLMVCLSLLTPQHRGNQFHPLFEILVHLSFRLRSAASSDNNWRLLSSSDSIMRVIRSMRWFTLTSDASME